MKYVTFNKKNCFSYLSGKYWKFGLHFIPTSGHTDFESNNFRNLRNLCYGLNTVEMMRVEIQFSEIVKFYEIIFFARDRKREIERTSMKY